MFSSEVPKRSSISLTSSCVAYVLDAADIVRYVEGRLGMRQADLPRQLSD